LHTEDEPNTRSEVSKENHNKACVTDAAGEVVKSNKNYWCCLLGARDSNARNW